MKPCVFYTLILPFQYSGYAQRMALSQSSPVSSAYPHGFLERELLTAFMWWLKRTPKLEACNDDSALKQAYELIRSLRGIMVVDVC